MPDNSTLLQVSVEILHHFRCPLCAAWWSRSYQDGDELPHYCPNCGAFFGRVIYMADPVKDEVDERKG